MICVDNDFMIQFGIRLKDLRKKKNLTIEKLVETLNKECFCCINEKTIRRYEKGQFLPEIDNLIVLSQFFDVSLDYLMYGIETSNDNSFTWYDSFKRLGRLVFSGVLIPWKIDDQNSSYYGRYCFSAFDKEVDIFMDKLLAYAKEWNYSFEKTGEIVEIDIHTFDNILKPTKDISDDLSPSIERLLKINEAYKQNPYEYINSVANIINKKSNK